MDPLCSGIELSASNQEIIVVSNREPCIHDVTSMGDVVVRRPASGLVTALEPVVQRSGGIWIAYGSGSADRLSADRHGHLTVEGPGSSYLLRRVWLTPEEEQGYYYGFANEGLWPLCHRAFSAPIFRRSDWIAYRTVNERFAEAIVEEARTAQPIVLVQDYHLALVPRLLRDRCPGAIIVAFWHIPWPNVEQFALCPYWRELVGGLLASDIVGFQTPVHCEKFVDTVENLHQREIDCGRHVIDGGGRAIEVRSYPISVEWPNRWTSCLPPVEECRRMVRARCGIDDGSSLIVSVDRLDYTKGLEERLAGIERLFEIMASNSRRVAFLQVAAPTRVAIERYGELAARVRTHIAQINGRFGDGRFVPVTYVERYMEPADVFQCYRAADVCYVGSLDDGMNLVAKEFVAARDDETGVLVLSQFAGAARELIDALIVNPYDVEGVAEALARALDLSRVDQQARMREMRKQIAAHNVHNWASEMLADAARVRQRDHEGSVVSADVLTSRGDLGDPFVRLSVP